MCATRQIEQGSDSSLHQKCLHFDTPASEIIDAIPYLAIIKKRTKKATDANQCTASS